MSEFSFSFSKLTTFEQCKRKYGEIYDLKAVKDEDSQASKEGQADHENMRKRVIDGTPLPPNLRHMELIAGKFAAANGQKWGEMKLALNTAFQPCGWFAKGTFVRCIIDLLIVQGTTGIVVDWKFGKRKDDFTQMGLNAAVLSKTMPELELFKTVLVYADGLPPIPKNYSLSKLQEVWADILPRAEAVRQAMLSKNYPPTRSGLCNGWCPVKHCEFYRDR